MTLIELILVMVIICTVLGMAAPSLKGFFGSRRTADAAARIVALTAFAHSQSVAEGRNYRLNVDLTDGRYWLTRQEKGSYARPETEFGREFALPDGTVADWEVKPTDAGHNYIQFYPNGRNDAATLRLTGRNGEVYDIASLSPVECFRVITPAEAEE